jgi:hypothetical protein
MTNVAPCRRSSRRRRARGLYLVELIAMLIVLSAVLLLVGQVAATAMIASREARRLDAMVTGMDAAVALLRRDAWSAAIFRTPASDRLEIEATDGRLILWNAAADGTLSRTSPGGVVRLFRALPRVTFTTEGALLTLTVARPTPSESLPEGPATAPARPGPADRLTFPSQLRLAGGAR